MRAGEWAALGFVCGFLAVVMADTLPPDEPDPPWNRPRPPLEGDEWMRDPEQGSQPDHAPPFIPAWPKKALRAGRVTNRCPRCGSNQLRFGNDLSFWCLWCERAFSPPMSYTEAMVFFTGTE